jgi:hypothetical protein
MREPVKMYIVPEERHRRAMACRNVLSVALVSLAAGLLLGCTACGDKAPLDAASGISTPKTQPNIQSLEDMWIDAGRFGIMLSQARAILNLPEAKFAARAFPERGVGNAQDLALADYQVRVAKEFFADSRRACKMHRVPRSIRALACEHRGKPPAELLAPSSLDLETLSARNDKVSDMIIPWWDAVCATAPKPRQGEIGACIME